MSFLAKKLENISCSVNWFRDITSVASSSGSVLDSNRHRVAFTYRHFNTSIYQSTGTPGLCLGTSGKTAAKSRCRSNHSGLLYRTCRSNISGLWFYSLFQNCKLFQLLQVSETGVEPAIESSSFNQFFVKCQQDYLIFGLLVGIWMRIKSFQKLFYLWSQEIFYREQAINLGESKVVQASFMPLRSTSINWRS